MSTDERQAFIDKVQRVTDLAHEVLYPDMCQFFDYGSDKDLDEKIEILTAMKSGKSLAEIPNFRVALELYPEDGEMWD